MTLRRCDGTDSEMLTPDGRRGNCGRTFDDTEHYVICPHHPISPRIDPIVLDHIAEQLADPYGTVGAGYVLTPGRQGQVFVTCNPCAQSPDAAPPALHWTAVCSFADV